MVNSCVTGLKPMDPLVCGTDEEEPPVFSSFKDFATSVLGIKENAPSPSSHPPPLHYSQENPNSPETIAFATTTGDSAKLEMAFLNIDPTPMLLPGFSRVIVQGRVHFARVVTPRAIPRNEDLTIVTVSPLPDEHAPFAVVREALLDLLVGHYGLRVRDIQRCPFGRGQTFVRLACVSDRDGLVSHSPHQFQGMGFEFVNHNRGANANPRRVTFNGECRLMIINRLNKLSIWKSLIWIAADEVIDPQPNIVEDPPADDEQISYSFQQDFSDEHSLADSAVNAPVVNALPDLNAVPGGEVVPADDVPGDEDAPVIVLGMEAPARLAAIAGLGAHAEPKLVVPPVGQIMGEDLGFMDVVDPLAPVEFDPPNNPPHLNLNVSLALIAPHGNGDPGFLNLGTLPALEAPAEKLVEVVEENQTECFEEKTSIPLKRPLVETEVRRSPRTKTRNGGFKIFSCSSMGYLACSACPPGLSINMIKAIGEDAYKVAAGTLSDTSLLTKNNIGKVVGGGKSIRKASDAKNEAAGSKKKKKSGLPEVEDVQDDDSNNKKKKKKN
ncbi:hypothetical protein C2845_PM10G01120 [Panicum miliaceum]|uniref:DUF7597 domain-containing protein n=1 Tax=Panicum miliaceum TaxID=4540 RepID=A0A3L6PGZ2_PANMI|nr:hypothetical protein C2845_PM10G01120 [Panicum miliaceum]